MSEDRSSLFVILFHLCMWWPVVPIVIMILHRRQSKKPASTQYPDDDAVE